MGVLLSASVFALLGLDWRYMPLALLVGLILGGLYCWSRSLLAPLAANTVLCVAMVGTFLGWLPNLPHPVFEVPGTWSHPHQNNHDHLKLAGSGPLQLFRSGVCAKGTVVSMANLIVFAELNSQSPTRYRFLDQEHIEIEWWLIQVTGNRTQEGPVVAKYHINVTEEELVLTRLERRGEDGVMWINFADTWVFGQRGAVLRFRRVR